MINLFLSIQNPLFKKEGYIGKFRSAFFWHKKLSKNKYFEIQFDKFSKQDLFTFNLDLRLFGRDHAGPETLIGFFGYELIIKIYDCRHWDYEKNCWQNYD